VFVDSGRVEGSAGRIYDVSGFAVGVGAGLGVVYDFLGFFRRWHTSKLRRASIELTRSTTCNFSSARAKRFDL
jgi:hypothetical protein